MYHLKVLYSGLSYLSTNLGSKVAWTESNPSASFIPLPFHVPRVHAVLNFASSFSSKNCNFFFPSYLNRCYFHQSPHNLYWANWKNLILIFYSHLTVIELITSFSSNFWNRFYFPCTLPPFHLTTIKSWVFDLSTIHFSMLVNRFSYYIISIFLTSVSLVWFTGCILHACSAVTGYYHSDKTSVYFVCHVGKCYSFMNQITQKNREQFFYRHMVWYLNGIWDGLL